jgi:fused signal recognition particle receptor
MGLFSKFKVGVAKTHSKLVHEIKRIVTRSPTLTGESIEELEAALIAADLGMAMTEQIMGAVKKNYEIQGGAGLDYLVIARSEIEKSLSSNNAELKKVSGGPTVVSIVGVNGTGKTTTSAKLAHFFQAQKKSVLLAACDTFRSAAIEQIKLWGTRLKVEVIAGTYRAGAQGGLSVH